MTLQRRSFTSLPSYLQTDRNNLELAVTDDSLFEPEQAKFVSGYIGNTSKLTSEDLARTPLLIENSAIRQKYQFSVAIAQFNPRTTNFTSGAFYDDLLNHLALNGALVNDPNRLFGSFYYAWSPPIDYDKIVNPARYFWTGNGNAIANGEYITKEAAGSLTTLFRFDGTELVPLATTIVNGLPGSGTLGQIVEDASTPARLLYEWNGVGWAELTFLVAADTTPVGAYHTGDFVYVCRTGPNFNRPLLWIYRPQNGRWVALPVVVSLGRPENPTTNMVWEDTTVPPSRIFRIYDGTQWQLLMHVAAAGPSGTPGSLTYLYDTRALSAVDSWSAQNWWRCPEDLSVSDRSRLPANSQAARPIIEFWGNIETAAGDTRTTRNQFPLFNVYAVSTSNFEILPINPANFPGLNTAPLIASGNYVGGEVVTRLFNYNRLAHGTPDPVLGFPFTHGADGTPLFLLELERLAISVGTPLLGYRFYKDTATGLVHTIWERTGQRLEQTADSNGLFDIPKNLKDNPDHVITTSITRSTYINHFAAVMTSQVGFTGSPYGSNNYRYTVKDLTLGASMIDPEESLLRVMAVLQTNTLDIPDAIRQMSREYNKTMARFLNQLTAYWQDGTLSTLANALSVTAAQAVDVICTAIFTGRNTEFPFFYSRMGTYTDTRIVTGTPFVFDTTPQPIYIPNSAAQIGASPTFVPEIFTDIDGITKIRGHDGSLIPAFNDPRDSVIIELENRFYASVPDYMKTETSSFSARFNSTFHLDDYYGDFIPNLTAGQVVEIVNDYTAIISPIAQNRIYSRFQQVYAIWDGTQWLTQSAKSGDVFLNEQDTNYYIFNGFYAIKIPTWNNTTAIFDYSFNEYRFVVQREFERWVVLHKLDFVTNDQFDQNLPFTWNYSSAGLEGNYRGIYRRIYRTVRPHSHPWELVGYSVRPSWWFTSYVPTSFAIDGTPRYANTHPMWTDFQAGVVNPLTGKIVNAFKLIAPIPVDTNGNLLDPIAAGIVDEQSLVPAALGDDWAYGDGAPVEEAFYNSYYYQFAVSLAGYLMKTALFVERTWSEFYRQIGQTGPNLLWNAPHLVADATLTRPSVVAVPSHLSLDPNGNVVVNPGLNSWIAEYTAIIGKSPNIDFNNAVINCQAVLGWKTSGFINAKRTRIELLNGDEIPNEDLSVILHQGPSLNEYFQSGIIVVRDIDGYRVFGTDVLNPYFRVELGAKPISGGQIELTQTFSYDGNHRTFVLTQFNIPPPANDTASFGILINGFRVNSKYVQRIDRTTFALDPVLMLTAGDKITASVVTTVSNPSTQLGVFTVNGIQITYFQTGTGVFVNYPYGTLFETVTDVVNMLIGHGRYLNAQGWIFERLTNGVLRDWLSAAKTFAIWATDLGLANRGNVERIRGAMFEFSVMGRQAQFSAEFGMVLGIEEVRNGSYGIVDVNGQPIRGTNLNVVATGGDLTVSTDDTEIFGLRLYVSEVQHCVFFPNTTTFGDIIYEPALGLAQDAVFVDTYRTTNWAGRMEAPGFLVSGGNLLPNWEKQTNDITRLYDRFNPVDDPILLGMARNIFGYVPKGYMDEVGADDRTKFNFFRGTLKAKGTFQPYLAYIRGTTIGSDNLSIAEDWAWKFAKYGDRRVVTVLFDVHESDFVDIFQAIRFDKDSFSLLFAGTQSTQCFSIPYRFEPRELVVQINGILQVLNVDYTLSPTDAGYNLCFRIAPLRHQTIIASINRGIVHVSNDAFYSASGGEVDTHMLLRSNNTFVATGGILAFFPNVNTTFAAVPPNSYIHSYGGVGEDIFVRNLYFGDGFNTSFDTGVPGLSTGSVIVISNQLWLTPDDDFVIDNSNPLRSVVQLTFTPALTSEIFVIATKNVSNARVFHRFFIADGTQVLFRQNDINLTNYREVIVVLNGLVQVGPVSGSNIPNTYTVIDGGVEFNTPPAPGSIVTLFILLDAVAAPVPEIEDDRVIHIPQFSPPNNDSRWVVAPPQDIYRDQPYRFPRLLDGTVDLNKYTFYGAIVDQTAHSPAVHLFDWNPARNLHEPLAMGLVDYKTPYDPARYNQGPLAESLDGLVWGENQIGTVWWDNSKAVYSDYEGFLPDYMRVTREWGRLKYFNAAIVRVDDLATVTTLDPKTGAPAAHNLITGNTVTITGADQSDYNGVITVTVASPTTFSFIVYSPADTPGTGDIMVQIGMINVYEWVSSPVPPTAWADYIAQQRGFNIYTGKVLNVTNPSYSTREVWDTNGNATTTYYFWVQNNTRIIPAKGFCVNDIAGRLKNPALYQVPFLAIMDPATMFVFTGDDVVLDDSAIEVSYEWYEMPRHVEWLLIGENDDFAKIPPLVTDKLLDSMLGHDSHGNPVPNVTLSPIDRLGTLYFPAQTVFPDPVQALSIYLDAINGLLGTTNIRTILPVFSNLSLLNELSNSNHAGYWQRSTFWLAGVDHSLIYDVVRDNAERDFRTAQFLYAPGDIVKVDNSNELDPFDHSAVVAYYEYNGTGWDLVGIENHAVTINANIINTPTLFRSFFDNLVDSLDLLPLNKIIFAVLFEMLRQNPICDWFFKTSYIDPHVTVPVPISAYVRPDQATAVFEAILDLKPFRTKIRDYRVTYNAGIENIGVKISESELERVTLIFDRLACDLTDENSWDTIPWDATVTYPESEAIDLSFIGDGNQTCFILPEIVPQEDLIVLLTGHLAAPMLDYTVNPLNYSLCFVVPPSLLEPVEVLIDSIYTYIVDFEYTFRGDNARNNEILPSGASECTVNGVLTVWNGVHQIPNDDFIIQVTSDTEVIYLTPPKPEIFVDGVVFSGVANDIFIVTEHIGDGATVSFDTTVADQTDNTVVVIVDGVWQMPGVDYFIDNTTFPGDSHVVFTTAPNATTKVVIYAAFLPNFLNTANYNYLGDGITTLFAVPNLETTFPPKVFVNLDGIQQNSVVGDYNTTTEGIVFAQPPQNGRRINIFVVIAGVGIGRLQRISSPSTIEWDWAFWNYPDLGRKEFDLAGVFVGDGVTEGFSLPIPQTTSSLYNVVLKFYLNGIPKTLQQLGITATVIKLSTGVSVFLSAPLPINSYCGVYVSRGFVEGPEPNFGFQDPANIVFEPTPATYQHYFAQLISATYDPSTQMAGCPRPEERIETSLDDMFSIIVKTIPQELHERTLTNLVGVASHAAAGIFAFDITSSPPLVGVVAVTHAGTFRVTYNTTYTLSGVSSSVDIGTFTYAFDITGAEAESAIGSFALDIDSTDSITGVAVLTEQATLHPYINLSGTDSAVSLTGTFSQRVNDTISGVVAMAQLGGFMIQLSPNIPLVGRSVTTSIGQLARSTEFDISASPRLDGLNVTAHTGYFFVMTSRGESVLAEIPQIVADVLPNFSALVATSAVGSPGVDVDPVLVHLSGQSATTAVGVLQIGISG